MVVGSEWLVERKLRISNNYQLSTTNFQIIAPSALRGYHRAMLIFADKSWPDALDFTATIGLLAAAVLIPAAGYVFMVSDFRTYLRSLTRVLTKVVRYLPEWPDWARQETPAPIASFGLRMPCTEDDLKRAYRKRVKKLHPDRGGDQKKFLRLQQQFEEALNILRQQAFLRSGPPNTAEPASVVTPP